MTSSEIDLHGLTTAEAIKTFAAAYNRSRSDIRVVHGYGSSGEGGVIRRHLRRFLEQHSTYLTWTAGETIDGNPGYTLVHWIKPLPGDEDRLGSQILAYCVTPRTETKIAGEFRRHTAKEVKEAIRRLKQQGKLKEIVKSGHTTYQA